MSFSIPKQKGPSLMEHESLVLNAISPYMMDNLINTYSISLLERLHKVSGVT